MLVVGCSEAQKLLVQLRFLRFAKTVLPTVPNISEPTLLSLNTDCCAQVVNITDEASFVKLIHQHLPACRIRSSRSRGELRGRHLPCVLVRDVPRCRSCAVEHGAQLQARVSGHSEPRAAASPEGYVHARHCEMAFAVCQSEDVAVV